jgi:RNA polymerase sigma-70 factor (ECF subfamily)
MRKGLAKLNPRDAACFVMRHFHDLAPADIGAALDMTENHVSVAAHRARKALERMYSEVQS